MISLDFDFEGELWEFFSEKTSWHFVTLPTEMSDDIKVFAREAARGFGSVRVHVRIGETAWNTSIFPSKEKRAYILPIKAAVRKAEGLSAGSTASVSIEVDT